MAKCRDSSGKFIKTHSMSESKEYSIWANMIYRCDNEGCPIYNNYGGRGISVSNDWYDFNNFIRDMGERPSASHSLERVDVNGNYCKENCMWETKVRQSRNRRNSRYVVYNGSRMQVDDYCELRGLSKHAIKNRIRRGWSNERIVKTPVR